MTTRKISDNFFILFLSALLAGILIGQFRDLLRNKTVEKPKQIKNWTDLTIGRSPSSGRSPAKVSIIEFSDYQCPYCAILEPRLQKLLKDHVDQVAFYRYDLPNQKIHPYARAASIAARCSELQGNTEDYQKLLFQRQFSFDKLDFVVLAKEAGISDLRVFTDCLSSSRTHQLIDRDIAVARNLSIDSTPTLVLNGLIVQGAVSLDELERIYRKAAHR